MAGGSNLLTHTIHHEDIDKLLGILSSEDRPDLWEWAKQQVLKRAREIKDTADRREILEAAMGLHEFTSMDIFRELIIGLKAIPRFPKTLGRGKYCPRES